jgi:hypothetical protein
MDTQTEKLATKVKKMAKILNERELRLYVAAEANFYGRGGVTLLHKVSGMARSTIKRGQNDLEAEKKGEEENSNKEPSQGAGTRHKSRVRRPGGGRKNTEYHNPGWVETLNRLVEPTTIGDPESSIRWTIKSTNTLADELNKQGINVSPNTIMYKLRELGYSLQSNQKKLAGASHPDRNAQFEFINNKINEFISQNNPIISVDTKKKEILGNFKNEGKQWRPIGEPIKVNDHDFASPSLPRALPYGIYDVVKNYGYINIGIDHDTSEFAVNSIYGWWQTYGESLYKNATKLLITADCGGSNGYRLHLWKYALQKFVDKIKIPVTVTHYPPGTSKWNKIEHKLFAFISSNWRGEPLVDYETVVKLISSTKTESGLFVSYQLDLSNYEIGIKLTKEQISYINPIKDSFHGEWNYTVAPH